MTIDSISVQNPEILLYQALQDQPCKNISYYFREWRMQEEDRIRVETEVRSYIPRFEALQLDYGNIVKEESDEVADCEETRKCYLNVSRIINAANKHLIKCGEGLVRAAKEGDDSAARAHLKHPISVDFLGKALVATMEGGEIGVLRKLKWRVNQRHISLDAAYYQTALNKILEKEKISNRMLALFQEFLALPIESDALALGLLLAIQGKKRWAIHPLTWVINSRTPEQLRDACFQAALDETMRTTDVFSFHALLFSDISACLFRKTLIDVARAGIAPFLDTMRAAKEQVGYQIFPSDYLAAIVLMISADDLISFKKILKFSMPPPLLGQILVLTTKARNILFLEALKQGLSSKLDPNYNLMAFGQLNDASDPLLVSKIYELTFFTHTPGKVLRSVVLKGDLSILDLLVQIVMERSFSLDPLDYSGAVDAAFKNGDEKMIAAMLNFPISTSAKIDHFKEATRKAALEGCFTILYRYFTLWKIPALNEPEIRNHANLLKEAVDTFFTGKVIAAREEIIASLKCAAMGTSILCNPFWEIEYLSACLVHGEISDECRELLFDIALEHKTTEAIFHVLNEWEMSDETRERVRGKIDRLEPHLRTLKELCLSHFPNKRRRQW